MANESTSASQGESRSGAACNLCGSRHHQKITHKRQYGINRCSDCGLIFVDPQPDIEELDALYRSSKGYFQTASAQLSATSPDTAASLDRLLSSYAIERGRFLDVGCSNGQLMYHMKALGWDVWGNDVNGEALDIAERHGLKVCLGTLERCKYPDSFFDAVHLGDLIEHVRSPRSLASDIFRILRPGGIVMIATPNAQSGFAVSTLILARATGIAWPHSEAPYHLYDFSPATISALLRDAGIKLLSINYGSSGSFSYIVGSSGYFDDLKQVLKREGQYKLNSSIFGYIPKLVAVSALLLPFWLYGLIADKVARRGRSMIVIGQRPLACQLCD